MQFMARGKQLTELERERIKILRAQGMSEQKIADKINRSRTLVHNAIQSFSREMAITKKAFEAEDVADYNQIINITLERLKKQVVEERMSSVALAKVVGIIFDKRQLLIGSPTAIEETNINTNDTGQVNSLIAAFAEYSTEINTTGSEGNSGSTSDVVRIDIPTTSTDNQD